MRLYYVCYFCCMYIVHIMRILKFGVMAEPPKILLGQSQITLSKIFVKIFCSVYVGFENVKLNVSKNRLIIVKVSIFLTP